MGGRSERGACLLVCLLACLLVNSVGDLLFSLFGA